MDQAAPSLSRPAVSHEATEEYRKHGPREVTLSTPWGNVYLVKERTGAERFEITPEEMQKISAMKAMFDGEVVEIGYEKPQQNGPERTEEIKHEQETENHAS